MTATVHILSDWQRSQQNALRRAALRPEPCATQADAEAYGDIVQGWARLRLMLTGARIEARNLEDVALAAGLPMPGIAADICGLIETVEHDIEAHAHHRSLVERIQEWEER